jgi:ABC-type transport system involved in cytochrome bd biosynthesis fused ATPase/permease subunit
VIGWPSVLLGVAVTACYIGQGLLAAHIVVRGLAVDTKGVVYAMVGVLALVGVRGVLIWACEVSAARGAEQVKVGLRLCRGVGA